MVKPNQPELNWKSLFAGALSMLSAVLMVYLVLPIQLISNDSKDEIFLMKSIESLSRNSINHPSKKDLAHSAIRGIIKELNDPYATFESGERLKREMPGFVNFRDRILYPIPKSDAESKGIMTGDKIKSINGLKIDNFNDFNISKMLSKSQQNIVKINLYRPGKGDFNVEVEKHSLTKGSIGNAQIIDKEFGIAHIPIFSFQKSTPEELMETLSKFEKDGMKALILDLRYNLGGSLDDAIKVASFFLSGELVCTIYDRESNQESFYAIQNLSKYSNLPLLVLINNLSASGSEILAAAFQEHKRAQVAGVRSYGKGFAQEVLNLESPPLTLKYSTGHYLTPKGNRLQKDISEITSSDGLNPDFYWPSPINKRDNEIIRLNITTKIPKKYLQSVKDKFPDLFQNILEKDLWLKNAIEILKNHP